jgi:hypothetical protein
MRPPLNKKRKRNGTTIIEFVLVTTLILVPLLLGTMVVGFNIIRNMQVHQVSRDAGHMFARGVDFSTTSGAGNRAILTYLAPRLADSSSAGTGVVIFSSIEYVGATTCNKCVNEGHAVFTRQLTIGNSALFFSKFGTVPTGSMATDGSGTVTNPFTDPAVLADGILAVLNVDGYTMNDSQIAYVSETYFTSTDFDIKGFLKPSAVYARAIF